MCLINFLVSEPTNSSTLAVGMHEVLYNAITPIINTTMENTKHKLSYLTFAIIIDFHLDLPWKEKYSHPKYYIVGIIYLMGLKLNCTLVKINVVHLPDEGPAQTKC